MPGKCVDVTSGSETSGQIIVGDGTTTASVAVSGDATLAANGALTIANDAVTNAMIADDAVDTDQIADDAVATAQLDPTTIQYATVTLSSAQILALDVTPVAIVAAGGSNIFRQYLGGCLFYDYESVAYTGTYNITVETDDGTTVSDTVAQAFNAAASRVATMIPVATGTVAVFAGGVANNGFQISSSAAIATGDGTARITIWYAQSDVSAA
jgi:hypothetical protein